jgi:hypothetical protein
VKLLGEGGSHGLEARATGAAGPPTILPQSPSPNPLSFLFGRGSRGPLAHACPGPQNGGGEGSLRGGQGPLTEKSLALPPKSLLSSPLLFLLAQSFFPGGFSFVGRVDF